MPERKILLIEPPFYRLFKDTYSNDRYPLSLGYLAGTVLKETDWDVMTFNADFSPRGESKNVSYLSGEGFRNYLKNLKDPRGPVWEDIRKTIAAYRPAVVGITSKTQNFASARIIAAIAKECNPDTLVLLGGAHASMVGADALGCADVDVVVRGEGERTLVELLAAAGDCRDSGDMTGICSSIPDRVPGIAGIQGICFRKDGRVEETPPRDLLRDLDALCYPHESAPRVLKDFAQYDAPAFRYVFATRGCPFNCFFCGSRNIWGRSVRFRSAMNVVGEIQMLRRRGLRAVYFDDDTFGVNPKYIHELCDALKTHCPGLKWGSEIHVNLVTDEIIARMKRAGCYMLAIGIESGNDDMLKRIRKGFTIARAHAAVNTIKKHGIEVQAFFMVGFPWETEATLRDTVTAMRRMRSDAVIYSIFTPYPGTETFALCREKGLVGDDFDVSLYNHQSPENCFCTDIAPQRFRELISGVEKMVDRKNFHNRLRKVLSLSVFWRIREIGVVGSIKKAFRMFFGG